MRTFLQISGTVAVLSTSFFFFMAWVCDFEIEKAKKLGHTLTIPLLFSIISILTFLGGITWLAIGYL